MGCKSSKGVSESIAMVKPIPNETNLKISDFKKVKAIGRGGFGMVHLVEKDGSELAMKEMLKSRVMLKESVESVIKEL